MTSDTFEQGDMERVPLNGMYHTNETGHRSGKREECLKGTRK